MLLLIIDLCHTFSWLLMLTVHGICGHIKASWDNHSNCLSCSSCSRLSTCSVCKNWTENTWDLADRRRLYCSRRSTMTKKSLAKKRKLCSQIYLMTTLLKMGSPPRKDILPGVGPILVATPQMWEAFIVCPQVTSHRAPVNQSSLTGHPGTGHQVEIIRHWASLTGHWSVSVKYRAMVNQSPEPVTSHQAAYVGHWTPGSQL